jgi:4-amino-4-deoxy-L-arabinose transferase-like glycosyltransferase
MKRYVHLVILPIVFAAYAVWIVQDVDDVPFHPDESSLLYQSRDFESWLTKPLSLTWDSSNPDDYDQTYRALNAPLTKYVLGMGRRLAGYGPESVSTDWDWSKTWQENQGAGALPANALLTASRLIITLLLPLSLLLMYRLGVALRFKTMGYAAVFFFVTNALLLLHNRRAMAEGVLTFGMCLSILGMFEADRKPWLAGLGAALATSAKYSCAPLLLVNFLACVWIPSRESPNRSRILRNILIYIAVAAITIFILSPIAWRDPLEAFTQIWNARQEFVERQVSTLRELQPAQALDTFPMRIAAMVRLLFLSPLQFEEVGNYHTQIAPMVKAYLGNPLHHLFRNPFGAGLLLFLTILGIVLGLRYLTAAHDPQGKRKRALLLLATALQLGSLLIAIPLPYQRYWIPVVPFICLWAAYSFDEILQLTKKQAAARTGGLSNQTQEPDQSRK